MTSLFAISSPKVELVTSERRKNHLRLAGWALLAAGFAAVLPLSLFVGAAAAFSPFLLIAAGIAFIVRLGIRRSLEDRGSAHVTVTSDALVLSFDGPSWSTDPDTVMHHRRWSIPHADVLQAYFQEPRAVVLQLNGGAELAVHVADEAEGRAFLSSLGRSATESVLRVPLLSPGDQGPSVARMFALLTFLVLLPFVAATSYAVVEGLAGLVRDPSAENLAITGIVTGVDVALLSMMYLSARYLKRGEVMVGADGVTVRGLLRSKFIPFASVTSVSKYDRGVFLELGKGRGVRLPVSFGAAMYVPDVSSEEAERRDALYVRIVQAREAAGKSGVAGQKLALLDRGGRTVEAWKASLVALPSRQATYRQQNIEPDELLRVAEDAASDPSRRVAATVALRAAGDEAMLERVRIAVDACADTDMKRALEEAAEGEIAEDEIARATAKRVLP